MNNRRQIYLFGIPLINVFRYGNKKRTIHFIHRVDETNTGDMSCCPAQYFNSFYDYRCLRHDIGNVNFSKIKKNDVVVLGGGGLFDCLEEWNIAINAILEKCETVMGWGIGFNTHKGEHLKTKIDFEKFKLLSIRDREHFSKFKFVPCCSCFINFPKSKIQRKIGIVAHKSFKIDMDYPCIDNNMPLSKLLKFIAESEIVVTTSYHGWYWATLMGKKVILANPFSTKFDHLPYPPVLYSGNLDADIKKAKNYPDALAETRRINAKFFDLVRLKI